MEPLMLLYHCNFGYPLVSANTRLLTSGGRVEPRDQTAAAGLDEHDRFSDPTPGYAEQCFYHHLSARNGKAWAALFEPELRIGAYVRYGAESLPCFVQWKMMGENEYVVGLEPATARLDGRAEIKRRQELRLLAPGEVRHYEVEVGVVEDRDALGRLG